MRALSAVASVLMVSLVMGCPTTVPVDTGTDDVASIDVGAPDVPRADTAMPDVMLPPDTALPFDASDFDAGSPVDAGTPEACTVPGTIESIRCGTMCGVVDRFCTSARVWEYGTCMEAGECVPGSTGPAPCGNCGTAMSRCDTSCRWVPSGVCSGEGECAPGSVTRTDVGCPVGQDRELVCNAMCTNEPGVCVDDTCRPGEMEVVRCGMCGVRERFCDPTGHWDSSAPCMREGECAVGTTRTATCGACGSQMETCDASCSWVPGMCTGELPCPPPPADVCLGPMTLRQYSTTPSCVMGACGYTSRDIPCVCTAGACATSPGLLRGLGGPAGFGTNNLAPNDDGSSAMIALSTLFPSGLRYYGTTHTAIYMNNNGNVSFGMPQGTYTPMFPATSAPLIAPFWGDVDTRGAGLPARNNVYWFTDATRFIATWHLVGYYASHDDLQNSFQIVLTSRSDIAPGDFDVELRYESCEWTTGDASGGTGGFGGTPAGAGFNAGDGTTALALPGSGTAAVLDLCTTSNTGVAGVWAFQVRGGIPR